MSDIKASFAGRRERGERGHRGATGPTGPTGPTGGSPPQFEPDRTLFVAQSWPAGVDPTVYFTDIPSAIAQAATLTPPPSLSDNVLIQIYPGTYPEDIVMQSGIVLTGVAGVFLATGISGNITWTPTGNVTEEIAFYFLSLANGITIDATGKTGGQAVCASFNCDLDGSTMLGNGPSGPMRTIFETFSCIVGPSPFVMNNCLIEWINGNMGSMQLDNGCIGYVTGAATVQQATASVPGPWNITTGSSVFCTGCTLTVPWNIDGTSTVEFAGCYLSLFDGSGDPISPILNVAAGGTADVRGSNYNGDANLAGPGTINRTTSTLSFGPTVVGANDVVFAVPFIDNDYNVALTLNAAGNMTGVFVNAKNNTDFTINDPIGGNTFDIVVTHD